MVMIVKLNFNITNLVINFNLFIKFSIKCWKQDFLKEIINNKIQIKNV